MLLQPIRWCCVDCVIHLERDMRENNTIIYVARASNSKRGCEHDLYCCLLPRCEALRTCRSGFPIATTLIHDKSAVDCTMLGTNTVNLIPKPKPST